jgi:hypothetical protein
LNRKDTTRRVPGSGPIIGPRAACQTVVAAVIRVIANVAQHKNGIGRDSPARRVFPDRIPGPEYPGHCLTRYVSTNGGVRFHRRYITIAPALIGEHVGFEEVADGRWALYVYNYLLGHLVEREGHIYGVHLRAKPVRSGD